MTRDLQLTFCLICANRQFNHDSGVICGLTKMRADFKDDCESFKVDNAEYKRICLEKIRQYGLDEKKTFLSELKNEFKNEPPDKYQLTRLTVFVKPRQQSEISEYYHFKKSIVKYGLAISAPLIILIIGIVQVINSPDREELLYIIFVLTLIAAFAGFIIFDFIKNENEFSVSEKGVHKSGQLIPWKTILTTAIKRTPTNTRDTYLVLSLATKEDIEIKLNGLKGMTEHVENVIELYKERYKASNQVLD